MFIDNLELTLGEFCDLIQTDEADAGVLAAEQAHRGVGTCQDAWAAPERAVGKAAIAGKPSCSSFLSDSSMMASHPAPPGAWASLHTHHLGDASLHLQGRAPSDSAAAMHCNQQQQHLHHLHGSAANLSASAPTNSCYLPEGSPHASTVHMAHLMQPGAPSMQPLQQQHLCGTTATTTSGLQVHVAASGSLAAGGMPSPGAEASTLEDDDLDAISRPPASHTSGEKQRRDRLNTLIDKLASVVPASDPSHNGSCGSAGNAGSNTAARRPKHAVLTDAIRLIRTLQEHVRSCPHANGSPYPYNTSSNHSSNSTAVPPPPPLLPPPAPSRAASLPSSGKSGSPTPNTHPLLLAPHEGGHMPPGTARSHPSILAAAAANTTTTIAPHANAANNGSSAQLGPLDMPLPLDIPSSATGVMVEAPLGSSTWRLRVTCRDRPGLLADVAVALRALPLTVAHASVTTTPEGKAQQVYEVSVLDASLAPEEIQCAINAALYAHLLSGNATTTTTAATAQHHHQPAPPATHNQSLGVSGGYQQHYQQQHDVMVNGLGVGGGAQALVLPAVPAGKRPRMA